MSMAEKKQLFLRWTCAPDIPYIALVPDWSANRRSQVLELYMDDFAVSQDFRVALRKKSSDRHSKAMQSYTESQSL